jgi:hypothetical protein
VDRVQILGEEVMRVLVACEFSGRVRQAFRQRGHDAWSCDLEPAEDDSPHHIRGDALNVLRDGWDLMVAHPPCTHLAVGGARYWAAKRADGRQQAGIDFFLAMAHADIPQIAIENPAGVMSSVWREPDQVIQPWQFGHEANKPTCLWLKGLPLLRPTNVVGRGEFYVKASGARLAKWSHKTSGTSADRARIASRTFDGIAQAMASQWSNYTDLVTQMETYHAL